MPLAPGTRLGPYEVLAPLGAGGMGEVYRARDARLGREVALKVLNEHVAGDRRDAPERLMREARLAAALNHPNLCTLHDAGEEGGRVYLAFELLEGTTLRQRIDAGPIDDDELVRWGLELADALAAAHRAGIVHRDLKPENVFVTARGTCKVLDFGVAGRLAPAGGEEAAFQRTREATIAGPGVIVGTLSYLAPEQARGLPADARSDVFALGALLHEMATGRRAFEGRTAAEVYDAILNRPPAPAFAPAGARPAELERIVERALEKDPDLRFQSAGDLRSELLRLQRSRTPPPGTLAAPAPGAIEPRRVLAILPFENLAADASSDYFAAGIAEEILGQLARLSPLRVLARASVAPYHDAPDRLRRLADERGVGSVVTGSVRLVGARVRIAVQLVEARSGRTLWAEQYDRQLEDVFAVQSDVALRIADALQATLSPGERTQVERAPTDNVAAYQLYLRALPKSVLDPEEMAAALELLRMAVLLDPGFAMAWARLARRLWFRGVFSDPSAWNEGRDAVARALELGPESGFVHCVRAGYLWTDGRLHEARRAHLRGIEVDPNNYMSMSDLSILEGSLGRLDDSLEWARRALPFVPGHPHGYYHLVVPLLQLEEFDVAERWLEHGLARHPDESRLLRLRCMLDLGRGDRPAAAGRIEALVARHPHDEEVRAFRPLVTAIVRGPGLPDQVRNLARQVPESLASEVFPTTLRALAVYAAREAGETAAAQGGLAEALAANRRQVESGDDRPEFFHERATLHALAGEAEAAVDWIERTFDAGFRVGWTMDVDPLLDPIRDHPRYLATRERMRADVARMRRRARAADIPLPASAAPAPASR
jgi:TolB-like protein